MSQRTAEDQIKARGIMMWSGLALAAMLLFGFVLDHSGHDSRLTSELADTGAIAIGKPFGPHAMWLQDAPGYKPVTRRADNTVVWSVATEPPNAVYSVANSDNPAIVTGKKGEIVGIVSAYDSPNGVKEITACDIAGTVSAKDASSKWQTAVAAASHQPGKVVKTKLDTATVSCLFKKKGASS